MQGKGKHTNYSPDTVVAYDIDSARSGEQEQQKKKKSVHQRVLQNMYLKAANKWKDKGKTGNKQRQKKEKQMKEQAERVANGYNGKGGRSLQCILS